MKLMKNTLLTVSKMIAMFGVPKATIAIEIGDLFSNGDRDRDCDRNFRDRGHALAAIDRFRLDHKSPIPFSPLTLYAHSLPLFSYHATR